MECVKVESNGDDIGDALCGRHFTNNHMRAAWRHKSTNLVTNQLRHFGFPTKADTFAPAANCFHRGRKRLTRIFNQDRLRLGIARQTHGVLAYCGLVDRRGSDP